MEQHPAERHVQSMKTLRTRAILASLALALAICVDVYDVGVRAWSIILLRPFESLDGTAVELEVADGGLKELARTSSLVEIGTTIGSAVLVLTAILFLRWIHRLVLLAKELGARHLSWSPSDVVWSFVIPILSFFRPYSVLTELEEQIDPRHIAEPPPRVERDGVTDYRGTKFVVAPPPKHVPRAMIGVWWGAWVAWQLLTRLVSMTSQHHEGISGVLRSYTVLILANVFHFTAGVLAIHVVLTLTGRLEERFRRIRYTEPDALEVQVTLR